MTIIFHFTPSMQLLTFIHFMARPLLLMILMAEDKRETTIP